MNNESFLSNKRVVISVINRFTICFTEPTVLMTPVTQNAKQPPVTIQPALDANETKQWWQLEEVQISHNSFVNLSRALCNKSILINCVKFLILDTNVNFLFSFYELLHKEVNIESVITGRYIMIIQLDISCTF